MIRTLPLLALLLGQDPAWWSPDWPHRRAVTVTNRLPGPLAAGYQVALELDPSALTGARADLEDLRVTHGGRPIPVVIRPGPRPPLRTAWFRTQKDLARGEADAGYAVYYGNRSAESAAAKPEEVFDFADFFSERALDESKWTAADPALARLEEGRLRAALPDRKPVGELKLRNVGNPKSFSLELEIDYATHPPNSQVLELTAGVDFQEPAAAESPLVPDLVRRLGDEDPAVRDEAQAKLVGIGRPARSALQAATRSPDPEISTRARKALEEIDRASPPPQIRAALILADTVRRSIVIGAHSSVVRKGLAAEGRVTLAIRREGDVGSVWWNGSEIGHGPVAGEVRGMWLGMGGTEGFDVEMALDSVVLRRYVDPFSAPTAALGGEEKR